jgi:putative ATPase
VPARARDEDLFGAAVKARLAERAPLAARMRPRTLDDVVGQDHLLAPGRPLRALVEADRLSSVILWGPPGTGKTTIAHLVADASAKAFEPLSAVHATVKDVREVIERARQRLAEQGQGTICFLDEIHRFNKAQQDALLPSVEDGLLVLIGATTENPFFEVNPPLLSRSKLFRLNPLHHDDLVLLAERGLTTEGATATSDALAHLADNAAGDARQLLNAVEVAVALASNRRPNERPPVVALADAEDAAGTGSLRYGIDEHYDVISAFIKSIRGSDPDAGLYWLARMLAAGEDPRFIVRRLVILASEDIGMADPMSLVVATSAAHALEFVGLPEAGYNLAQAVVHLATAPKSNRTALALWAAQADVREIPGVEVPIHLRDASYRSAKRLGHGVGYQYPHEDPRGWVPQQYRPAVLSGHTYYTPSSHGAEADVARREQQRIDPPAEDDDR